MSLDEGSLSITSDKIKESDITDYMTALSITSTSSTTLPTDILRLVFETAVQPDAYDNRHRQTTHKCCLVSKEVNSWVEPMLYENIVLESSKQVAAFHGAFRLKLAEFLARTVKAVWILDSELNVGALYRLFRIFNICHSLERFVCLGSNPCIRILKNIPKPQNGPYNLRELAILQPGSDTARYLSLRYLSLSKLQLINSGGPLPDALCLRLDIDEELLDALRAIPKIYFDYTSIKRESWIVSKSYHCSYRRFRKLRSGSTFVPPV